MKSLVKILDIRENIRAGYTIMWNVPESLIWNALMTSVPSGCRYIHHIVEDIFKPYEPLKTETEKSPTLNQMNTYTLGIVERTLTIFYEERS